MLTLFYSCATTSKITALKPEPDDASPLVHENTPSFISIPIAIKLKDIENQTNKLMNGLIYEDTKIEDDDLKLRFGSWLLFLLPI